MGATKRLYTLEARNTTVKFVSGVDTCTTRLEQKEPVKGGDNSPDIDFMSNTTTTPSQSRAVTRAIEPGCAATCARCDQPVKFIARVNGRQVIANVYESGRWQRVEHFHYECYEEAESPYGEPA